MTELKPVVRAITLKDASESCLPEAHILGQRATMLYKSIYIIDDSIAIIGNEKEFEFFYAM